MGGGGRRWLVQVVFTLGLILGLFTYVLIHDATLLCQSCALEVLPFVEKARDTRALTKLGTSWKGTCDKVSLEGWSPVQQAKTRT